MKHRKSSYLIIGIILVLTGLIISNFLLADIKFSPFADKKAIYFPSIEAYYDTCSIGLNNQYLYIKADTFIGDLQGKADEAYNSDSLGGNYWTGYLLSTAQDTFTYIIGDSTSVEKVEADIGDIDSLWTSNIYMSDGGIIAQAGGASMQIGLASDYIYEAYLNNLYTYNVAVSESLSAPSIYTDTIQDGFYLKGGLVGNGYILLGGAISTEAGQDITSGGKMFSSDDITCDNNIYGDALINNANNPLEVRADVSLSDSVCLRIVYDTDSITGDTMGNLRVSGKTYFDGDISSNTLATDTATIDSAYIRSLLCDVLGVRHITADTLTIGDEMLVDIGSYLKHDGSFNTTMLLATYIKSNDYVLGKRFINKPNETFTINVIHQGYDDSITYQVNNKTDTLFGDTIGNLEWTGTLIVDSLLADDISSNTLATDTATIDSAYIRSLLCDVLGVRHITADTITADSINSTGDVVAGGNIDATNATIDTLVSDSIDARKLHISQSGTGYLVPAIIENPGDPGAGATTLQVKNSQSSFNLRAYGSGSGGRLNGASSLFAGSRSNALLLGASGSAAEVYLYSYNNYLAPEITIQDYAMTLDSTVLITKDLTVDGYGSFGDGIAVGQADTISKFVTRNDTLFCIINSDTFMMQKK